MCEMDVATWFLILVSNTMIVEKGLDDALNAISSKFFCAFWYWKDEDKKKNNLEKDQQDSFLV